MKETEIVTKMTKTKVFLREYITGGQFEKLQRKMLEGIKVGGDGKASGEIDATVAIDQTHEQIELIVTKVISEEGTEVTESKEILKTLQDLPREDYQEVVDKVGEIANPKAAS
ncbi:MAG: hypothetical protein KAS32_21180 [Candidatus Peribacteraceae bacterium]|nr:hypothetical protein [Candidatus Peribacteraceae bacterium]